MMIKRVVPKTIREVAENLQKSQITKFSIYEITNRNELETAKQRLGSLWSQHQHNSSVSIIAVVEKTEQEGSQK